MEGTNLVCDLCRMDAAASACICRFPLPKLCIPCDTKHKNSSGSHFALPLAAIGTIGQGNWLQWHSYLVGVGVVLQNLMNSLEAFNTFQGQIEGIFASIHEELASLQNEYFAQLQGRQQSSQLRFKRYVSMPLTQPFPRRTR